MSASTVQGVEAFGAEFDVRPGYCSTPSVGVPPRAVVDAVRDHVEAWSRGEATGRHLDEPIAAGRAGFAALAGVEASRVAIGSTVSGLLGPVASSLPRGRVITAAREFASVCFPFAACGHDVLEVDRDDLAERAAEADVVAVSVVASDDGAPLDLPGLQEVARAHGTVVVLDATQSLGWLPTDLSWADVVVAAGYKWLLAPRGVAWLAVSDRMLERIVPIGAGWFAAPDPDAMYGLPLRSAEGARRLDVSPAWVPQVGAGVSLPWLAALDRSAVHAHTVGLADHLRAGLGLAPRDSAIVSVGGREVAQRLAVAGVRATARHGAVRLGFHLYNTADDVDLVLDALAR